MQIFPGELDTGLTNNKYGCRDEAVPEPAGSGANVPVSPLG